MVVLWDKGENRLNLLFIRDLCLAPSCVSIHSRHPPLYTKYGATSHIHDDDAQAFCPWSTDWTTNHSLLHWLTHNLHPWMSTTNLCLNALETKLIWFRYKHRIQFNKLSFHFALFTLKFRSALTHLGGARAVVLQSNNCVRRTYKFNVSTQ